MAKKSLLLGLVIILAVVYMLATNPPFKFVVSDPEVREAWQICRSVPAEARLACYEKLAVEQDNPDVCWLAGPSVDDACMQTVFEKSKDPNICSRISKPGVKILCEQYFRKASLVVK